MTLPVRKSLHDAVLQASKADTWEQATKEWNEVSLIFNGIGRSNCVCGNAIKYAYELFNGVTGQRLFPKKLRKRKKSRSIKVTLTSDF